MPFRQLPRSDAELTKAVDAAHKRWVDLAATPAKRIITPAHFAELDLSVPTSFRSQWQKEIGEAVVALSVQVTLTSGAESLFNSTVQIINHFFIVLDCAIERHVMPISDRVLFERPANATSIPIITNYADALLWGARIKAGELARQAAGGSSYLAMSLPSASEVAIWVDAFDDLLGRQDEAQSHTSDEARDISQLRPEGDTLVRSMWNTIEFHLSEQGLAPSALRTEARLWGITYITRPGEPEDPTPTPPTP